MSRIPGFRTNVKWKKIIATILYPVASLISLIFVIGGASGRASAYDSALGAFRFLLLVVLVAIPIFTWRSSRRAFPWARKSTLGRVLATTGYFILGLVVFGLLSNLASPQEKALEAKQLALQKAAAERAAAEKAAKKAAADKAAADKATADKATADKAAADKAAADKAAADKAAVDKAAADKAAADKAAADKAAADKAAADKAAADKAAADKAAADKAAADKAAAQEEAAMVSAYKHGAQAISWDSLARNPDKYTGDTVKFTGEVVTILNSFWGSKETIQVAVKPDGYGGYSTDQSILVNWTPADPNSDRILDNDIITVYGSFDGIDNYKTVLGASESAPNITAKYIDILGQGN